MFGISFLEIAVVGLIALVVVGPQRLPAMMRTVGEWVGKLRRMTSDMRAQTGIDDILREEGIDGVAELRTLLRGGIAARRPQYSGSRAVQHYTEAPDPTLEFPLEGVDCSGALPDDLFTDPSARTDTQPSAVSEPPTQGPPPLEPSTMAPGADPAVPEADPAVPEADPAAPEASAKLPPVGAESKPEPSPSPAPSDAPTPAHPPQQPE